MIQDNARTKNQWLITGATLALVLVATYTFIYEAALFSETINLLLENILTVLSALSAAAILTRVTFFFEPGEPPRRIWWTIAAAFWLWTVAEAVWAYFNMSVGEVPLFSAADISFSPRPWPISFA